MLTHMLPVVWQAERAAAEGGLLPALRQLRRLGLAEFGDVMLALPDRNFPELSRLLPRMPEEAVQRNFNGGFGTMLMHDSVSFVRVVASGFQRIAHRPLQGGRILDFGCGWGRLLRLLPLFTDPDQIFGVDPMDRAIPLCRDHGVLGQLATSEFLPRTLPVGEEPFDLIYSYSVFTHLSLRAMDAAMAAMRRVVAADGLLVVTIRPIEYWDDIAIPESAALRGQHLQAGFAFNPHNHAPVDGDVTYGDSSVDIPWFAARYAEWELRFVDRGWDARQTALFLTPR